MEVQGYILVYTGIYHNLELLMLLNQSSTLLHPSPTLPIQSCVAAIPSTSRLLKASSLTYVAIRYWLLTFFIVDFMPNRELRLLVADWLNTIPLLLQKRITQ
jgi:hypothetical protein